ncbi:MAG: M48 family metallopeptidase [Hyphomicrobiales bacterium]
MHGRNSVSFLLEQEKTQLRDSIAQKIGANPEDITRAMDTSQAGEIANARRIKRETLARYGRSKDKAMEAQLQKVANRLSLAFVGSGGMKYEVVLVKNETMNAFTPGGGIIVINEGLLMFCDTEGEVAAVMAHEMGHVLRRDPLKQRQMSLVRKAGRSITAAITPQSMDKSLGNALRLGGGASMNASTRVQEAEADSLGIDIMVAAGYDPREMVHVQETFMLYAPQESRLANVLYGNHPLSKDRADAARRKIAKQYPDVGGDVTTAAYDALAKRYQERRMAQIARKL